MAAASNDRILTSSDLFYLLTFALGMAAFWLSGKASQLLPVVSDRTASIAMGLGSTAAVYGLGMLALSLAVTRRFGRPVIISTVLAIILGLAAAQVIVRVFAPMVHSNNGVGLLTFGLYLCYGVIYVVGLAVARRFAR